MVVGLRGFPQVQGGIEKHCEELYPEMVSKGECRVTVVVRKAHCDPNRREYRGVALKPIWSPERPGLEAFVHTFLAVCYAIVMRPDVLHIHAVGPGLFTLLARLFFLQVVFTHHGFDYEREKWSRVASSVLRLGEFIAVKLSNRSIAVSKVAADRLSRDYARQVVAIHNGISLSDVERPYALPEKWGLKAGRYFVSIARIVPEKRQSDLIAAFLKTTREWDLVIVGANGGDDAMSNLSVADSSHSQKWSHMLHHQQ